MSRAKRMQKLEKVWARYTKQGTFWTRESVCKRHGVRMEDVSRMIALSGPGRVREDRSTMRWHLHSHEDCQPRIYVGLVPDEEEA